MAASLLPAAAVLCIPVSASASSRAPSCSPALAHLHHHSDGAGLGHAGWVITVVNVSASACTITGFPAVTLLASHDVPAIVATPTRAGYLGGVAGSGALPSVVLAHGHTASALLEGLDAPLGNDACPTSWGVKVRLPGSVTTVRLRFAVGLCASVQIHPFVPGDKGSQS
ncbi:hypothetical protein acdb102_38740 [Acidothermaceae bacterium B102]|nr:hypothetical protein acdb102_38740 [Acidothermaceae bacterium B102]